MTSNDTPSVIHELRHAYQNAAIDNSDLYVVSDETRDVWKENIDNYISGGQIGYEEQPIEWDVRNFANQSLGEINIDLITYEGSWEK